jgi:hypothetical protein
VGAPAALHAAAEAVIDLAHPHALSGVGKLGTNLLVADHVARTDDHDFIAGNPGIVAINSGVVSAN